MLTAAGVPFEPVDSEFDEGDVKASLRAQGIGAADLARALARQKALAARAEPGALVLGSDSTLELDDGTMLDKPGSAEDLSAQLARLSGSRHHLHSAAVIVEDGNLIFSVVESPAMHVRTLSADFIRDYVAREYETVRWSVGGYHVEGRGVQLFDRIEGSLFAVQGLPLLSLLAFLRQRLVLPT
jgi:septum formation protein